MLLLGIKDGTPYGASSIVYSNVISNSINFIISSLDWYLVTLTTLQIGGRRNAISIFINFEYHVRVN